MPKFCTPDLCTVPKLTSKCDDGGNNRTQIDNKDTKVSKLFAAAIVIYPFYWDLLKLWLDFQILNYEE